MSNKTKTVLAPCFSIKGKWVRKVGYPKEGFFNKELRLYQIKEVQHFRVLDKGRWKDVSPSQRKLIN